MSWRLYQAADQPSVQALHIEMQARLGMELELPRLNERPVLIALVYENDGVITHAAFLEAQAEFCAMGEAALPRSEWTAANKLFTELCKVYDIAYVRAFVPAEALKPKLWPISRSGRVRLSPIERILNYFGFVREDQNKITTFTRRMN